MYSSLKFGTERVTAYTWQIFRHLYNRVNVYDFMFAFKHTTLVLKGAKSFVLE